MNGKPDLLMVHGYNHSIEKDGKNSPFREGGNFDRWPRIFTDHNCEPVSWYSGIQFSDTDQAQDAGHFTTYAWSYADLATAAAKGLLSQTAGREGLDVVAHSLGTRVVLLAIKERPEAFRKVLMLNGAETIKAAMPIIRECPGVEFLNIAVKEDDVLKYLGARFEPEWGRHGCIGNGAPIVARRLPNFDEIILDDADDQAFFASKYGWDLQGDGPGFGDHSHSFEYEGNHDLYRGFFEGKI